MLAPRGIGRQRFRTSATRPEPVGAPLSEEQHALLDRWLEESLQPPRRFTKRRLAVGLAALLIVAAAGAYTQKDRYTDDAADLSRRLIGDERTARVESYYFRLQDQLNKLKYRIRGAAADPFANVVTVEYTAEAPARVIVMDFHPQPRGPGDLTGILKFAPVPLRLPETKKLRENPDPGEGVWTTAGLPRSSPEDPLMARTFFKPDRSRPFAQVGVLLVDGRRARMHIVGGTVDPGGDLGVRGPGAIPAADQKLLLAAWNGGFKGPHGGFGMVAAGKQYRPLRNGLASVAVFDDGTVKMGEWGKTLSWDEHMVAVRQNAVLLVDNCEVSKRTNEGNDTWGYVEVNSAEFITWRSAIGLTKDGHLLIASGNSLSAATLAQALWAAGACTAMQLDINSPYVLTSLYFAQADGTVRAEKFLGAMPDSATRFFKTQERDFFYLTFDETRYRGGP